MMASEGPDNPMDDYSYDPQNRHASGHGLLSPDLIGTDEHSHDHHDDPDSPDAHKTRLRKACDSCSVRKIRCDESGPPCQPCSSLNIPCTWNRPTRRRGPPNRHAEAIKRQRVEHDSRFQSEESSPASPTNAAHTLTALSRSHVLSAESICPMLLLNPLIDDYFTYIHPLVPIPHEPTFREALNKREDLHNPTFLSMLAAMVGALVVSFPRKPRLHLKVQSQEALFPKSMNLVDRCHKITIEARGVGFMDKRHSIYDATTSYLLALSTGYSLQWRQSKLYFGETLLILRALGLHKSHENIMATPQLIHQDSAESSTNYITRELGRRLFWVVFVGIQSFHQIGLSSSDLYVRASTTQDPHPPLPLEIDDRYIFADRIDPQPVDVISELVGFNANVHVYRSYNTLENLELTMGIGRTESWDYQSQVLQACLHICKGALNDVPHDLRLVRPGQESANFGLGQYSSASSPQSVNTPRRHGPVSPQQHWDTDRTSLARRRLQYEIQKANIYISQLGTRSHIVDRYWSLFDTHAEQHPDDVTLTHTDAVGAEMAAERELIVRDLLVVVRSIGPVNMEPNGGSLIAKIRSIASTLLDGPRSRMGTLALRAQGHLFELVELLMKLERVPRARAAAEKTKVEADVRSPDTPRSWGDEDEEAELQHWADFRDVQRRFADSGGVLDL